MSRRPSRALPLLAVLVAVAGCGSSSGPSAPATPSPTVGQITYVEGNEDPCEWDGEQWVETDDGELCEPDEPDTGKTHKAKSSKATPKATAKTTTKTRTTRTRRASN